MQIWSLQTNTLLNKSKLWVKIIFSNKEHLIQMGLSSWCYYSWKLVFNCIMEELRDTQIKNRKRWNIASNIPHTNRQHGSGCALMGTHEFGKFRRLRVNMIVCPKLFPNGVGRTWSLSSEWKLDQADFTDWISFLRSNPMGKKPALIMWFSMLTPKTFHQHEKAEKTMI